VEYLVHVSAAAGSSPSEWRDAVHEATTP
jgi:hypothetical protein